MKKVRLFEQFINEASSEEKEAKAILQDLLGEYDPWELGDMTEEEAEEAEEAIEKQFFGPTALDEMMVSILTFAGALLEVCCLVSTSLGSFTGGGQLLMLSKKV